ncbi:MAG: PH domain-containing protein [Patescibacteria group bacterium]|nr:PH domain-containing protein [Patescibacteria group bacterium]
MKHAKEMKYFESQDKDENVILVVRKHKLVLSMSFLVAAIIILFSLGLYIAAASQNILENNTLRAAIITIISVIYLFSLLYSFMIWLIKYLDILILTNKHLVIVRQDGLFKRGTSILDLSTIQDVCTRQSGVLQTVLNFGKIDIQTAGETPNFTYSGVGSPASIQDAVMDAKELYVKKDTNISSAVVTDSNKN